MKLTPAQRSMMVREFPEGRDDFILLHTAGDDRVAKALSNKGLGYFTDNGWRYTWRTRGGYFNLFTFNEAGHKLRKELTDG
jgi:hypothetical protein